jgi:hypothetical protein
MRGPPSGAKTYYTTLVVFGDNCNGTIITPRIIIADVDIAARVTVCIFEAWGRRRPAYDDGCRLHRHHHPEGPWVSAPSENQPAARPRHRAAVAPA